MRIQRFVDLSVTLENGISSEPPGLEPRIDYMGHAEGARLLATMFPGLRPEDLPDAEGWAVEHLHLHTHSGTHLDAPWHYASTMNGGERAMAIDAVPLEWCFAPGIKLDFRHVPDGHVVSAAELADELKRIGCTVRPLDIVLMNTAAGKAYGSPDYVQRGCGFGRQATLWLLERGVRVMGTDAWSWDAPMMYMQRRYAETGDPSVIWEGHKAGREIGFCHLEKLTNLDLLPPTGFWINCFPFKIKGASAGFTRAVALFEAPAGEA
ncbi:MAG: cyclase family protein [Pseudomonadota bacterium]